MVVVRQTGDEDGLKSGPQPPEAEGSRGWRGSFWTPSGPDVRPAWRLLPVHLLTKGTFAGPGHVRHQLPAQCCEDLAIRRQRGFSQTRVT